MTREQLVSTIDVPKSPWLVEAAKEGSTAVFIAILGEYCKTWFKILNQPLLNMVNLNLHTSSIHITTNTRSYLVQYPFNGFHNFQALEWFPISPHRPIFRPWRTKAGQWWPRPIGVLESKKSTRIQWLRIFPIFHWMRIDRQLEIWGIDLIWSFIESLNVEICARDTWPFFLDLLRYQANSRHGTRLAMSSAPPETGYTWLHHT